MVNMIRKVKIIQWNHHYQQRFNQSKQIFASYDEK
jgi:uncharacterized protein VirK/YbjX